jgi:pseudouridine-5'-monophosphatase
MQEFPEIRPVGSQTGSTATHVLFDLDGVLLDTEPLYTAATQAVVGRFGKTYDWSLKRHTMGRDARLSARFILEQLSIPLTPEAFLEERAPILEALLATSPVVSGAERLVRELVARAIPIAVATSSDRHLFELKTRPHDWFDCFGVVVCGDDRRVAAKKPAPDIFLAAAADLGAEPAQCVVLEDSPAGVEAALAAGMRVVAMPDPAMDLALYRRAHQVIRDYGALGVEELLATGISR